MMSLLNTYSGKNKQYLMKNDFLDLTNFIMKANFGDNEKEKRLFYVKKVNSLFKIFRSYVVQRMPFENFNRMVVIGKQVHPFYL